MGALPVLAQRHVERALLSAEGAPETVLVRQEGQIWMKPNAHPRPFTATEEFDIERVAFAWRARFPLFGPLALSVADAYAGGDGQLRLSLLGIPLQTQTGTEIAVGEAMRYLSEIAWVPYALVHNSELSWGAGDGQSVELATDVRGTRVAVRLHFDEAGDIVGATGTRPFPKDGAFVPTPWGGDFGEYATFGGVRVPARGEAWWDLPEGRFVYWRGRVIGVELLDRPAAITARA